jgi:hypothetical protein
LQTSIETDLLRTSQRLVEKCSGYLQMLKRVGQKVRTLLAIAECANYFALAFTEKQ